ncbi:g10666 [Coccomyxa elongata]
MLAGVPLLHPQRSIKPAEGPGPCWLGLPAKVAVILLTCSSLVQFYLLLTTEPVSLYQSCSDCQATLQSQTGMVVDIAAIQAAMPASARAEPTPLLPFPNHQFAVFIIFSWNYKLFWSSLQTFVAAGWGKRIIIIDNSPNRLVVNDSGVNALVGEVIPTRVRLTFSQAQNIIADIAIERNYTFFFWGHSDVALLASNATTLFAEEVMACMEKVMAEEADWGVVFFRYDWFSAVRTEVVRVVRYDTFITVYKSDCDFYPRVRQRWRTLNHSGVCRGCKIQVLDMKRGLKLPLDDYEATKEILTAEGVTSENRNRWKKQEWSIGEQIGWELWEHTSWHYFRYKWGQPPPGHKMCLIEENLEEDGGRVKRLRQQPFETVHHLLPDSKRHPVREADLAAKLQRMF